jgi:hypothetical protein
MFFVIIGKNQPCGHVSPLGNIGFEATKQEGQTESTWTFLNKQTNKQTNKPSNLLFWTLTII